MLFEQSHIAVMGAGAVGCFFGGRLARAGRAVTLIARPDHVRAIQQHGLRMNCLDFQQSVVVSATDDVAALADVDLVLLSVKSPDTGPTMLQIRPFLKPDACILSLQNGVDNCDRIRQLITQPAYAAVVYVAAAMTAPGTLKHFGRGELVIGDPGAAVTGIAQDQLNRISEIFQSASIPCTISANIKHELWFKFLVNCVYNGISAIAQIRYGEMVKVPQIRELIEELTREFLQVAQAEGVNITWENAMAANQAIADTMAGQRSSTAQDLARSRPTEIDFLNGLIVKQGKVHGIPTPAHQAIYGLVKMMEQTPARGET
ncbi:MAG: ketopantoate reductase family protein [Burkholderiaceae bacterium]|nr:ketopantoate reductase family protein [Burkholderiaceae bacterium]